MGRLLLPLHIIIPTHAWPRLFPLSAFILSSIMIISVIVSLYLTSIYPLHYIVLFPSISSSSLLPSAPVTMFTLFHLSSPCIHFRVFSSSPFHQYLIYFSLNHHPSPLVLSCRTVKYTSLLSYVFYFPLPSKSPSLRSNHSINKHRHTQHRLHFS